jgi:hypothetical protein
MILQNVTSLKQLFDLNNVNIEHTLDISVHFEILPLNTSVAYLFIYKFDSTPLLNISIRQIDGWSLFCPSSKMIEY